MTKKKKRAILFSAFALIAVILIGTTLAYFTDTDAKQNVFSIGKVTGTLNEKKDGEDTKDNGKDGFTYDNIKPGDSLDKEPYVELGSSSLDAYARVKITVNGLDDTKAAEVLNGLTGIGTGWVKVPINSSSCYYYYQSKLSNDSKIGSTKTTNVFTTVKIPGETWGNEVSGLSFTMDITGDLIQADNFTPQKDASGNIIGWTNSDGSAVTIENAN